jgi:hypothetical protein
MTIGAIPLAALQAQFQQHLLACDGLDAGAAADLAAQISPGGIGVARRLHIYHHAYRMRLVDALRDTFGHTLLYMGDDEFNAAALACVEAHPSTHASLRDYGEHFAQMLAKRFPQAGELAELALLDRTLRHTFDGPDAPVLLLADLAAVAPADWAEIGFVLHPTVQRLRLMHNTVALWHALDQDQAPPGAMPLAEPGDLLVWRRGQQPHFRSLQALEAAALDCVADGQSFAALCHNLSMRFSHPSMAAEVGGMLRRWVEDGVLSTLR